jgi:hypothetical protein
MLLLLLLLLWSAMLCHNPRCETSIPTQPHVVT